MSRTIIPSQQKLAEKLTILNDRGIGMLTRFYNIKKACSDPKSKPSFLSEKSLEGAIKTIVRKFPHVDIKGNQNSLAVVNGIKSDIVKSLSLYYFTFVDLLDFKDHVTELLTTVDACQVTFNITYNFDLTKSYLDLMSTYVSLMILLSQVEDRKAVLGLFNVAHEMSTGNSDANFPRLGQMLLDYDPPMKKLAEEFVPHSKALMQALVSLQSIFPRRNLTAQQWRSSQMLSIVAHPGIMLNPAQTETMPCEYLSLEVMERWIIFGFMLCHPGLQQYPEAQQLWQNALQFGYVMQLFRDETLLTHTFIISFFEGIKGYGKRVSEVKESHIHAVQNAAHVHRERRKFLRTALKELTLILTDQPGLLGPKALFVFMGLSFSRDEVNWLLRHADSGVGAKTSKGRVAMEDLMDRALPELLFHMEELRALVRKYNQVIQRYYVQYLSGYDAIILNQLITSLNQCPEEESVILSSFYQIITNLSVKQVEEGDLFDLRGFRLDWFRLQTYMSMSKSSLKLLECKDLAKTMNTLSFHTKMVDGLDDMLVETSDLSIFCFYSRMFEQHFQWALDFPPQLRYIVAFPLISGHFMSCCHDLCPEERHCIGERSLALVNSFLDEMAKEVKTIVTNICGEHCILSDQCLPKTCAQHIAQAVSKKKKDKKKGVESEPERPGRESYRRTRENLTQLDVQHMALTELGHAINYCTTITVWDHAFTPREYMFQHLEARFNKAIENMMLPEQETSTDIAKPSEVINSLNTYMSVLESIENYVHLDITRLFNSVLLQQTQPQDSHGEKTITARYTNWYLDVLLRKVSAGQLVYSKFQHCFINHTQEQQPAAVSFNADEYTDITELRALAELIGPYGVKYLTENLMWHIASQVSELKKLVIQNKEILMEIRTSFDDPKRMKELTFKLQNLDSVIQRMTIIGVILSFHSLLQEALNDVLTKRIPFLLSSVKDLHHHVPNGGVDIMVINDMAEASGLQVKVSPTLCSSLRAQKPELNPDEEYTICCLLMVFIAISIPKLAKMDTSVYKPQLKAMANNSHCIGKAVNAIAAALFTNCARGDIDDRLKEFLALCSSSLLRLGQEIDKETIKNREAVYILLDEIVQESEFLTMDLLESCFPYVLLRNAHHAVYQNY